MRFQTPFEASKRIPHVPARLAMRIDDYIAGTERIEIQFRNGTKWERINTLHLEGEGVGEEELVGALVKACADHHAHKVAQTGKYRAVMRRRVGVEKELRRATFIAEVETAEQRRRRRRIKWTGKGWPDIALAYMRLLETMAEFQHRTMDLVVEQQRLRRLKAQKTAQLQMLMAELIAMCEDGLRMQTEAAHATMEARLRQRLDAGRTEFGERLWDAVAPGIESALGQIQEMIKDALGTGVPADAKEEPVAERAEAGEAEAAEHGVGCLDDEQARASTTAESDAERTEGAPPSSGDAPSPGKDAGS